MTTRSRRSRRPVAPAPVDPTADTTAPVDGQVGMYELTEQSTLMPAEAEGDTNDEDEVPDGAASTGDDDPETPCDGRCATGECVCGLSPVGEWDDDGSCTNPDCRCHGGTKLPLDPGEVVTGQAFQEDATTTFTTSHGRKARIHPDGSLTVLVGPPFRTE